MLEVFEKLWDEDSDRLKGAVCVMMAKLAQDHSVRRRLIEAGE